MDANLAAVIITVGVSLGVSLGGSWLVAKNTASNRDHLRIAALESRVDILEQKREQDAIIKRLMGDHIDVLENHIWERKGPPPPARPEGI